jgi:ectoine hydroxylase-related dioxygenase (phytanoyl-CoA dioxygenase family)
MTVPNFRVSDTVPVEAKRFYGENGFVVFKDFVDSEVVGRLYDEALAADGITGDIHGDGQDRGIVGRALGQALRHRIHYFTQRSPAAAAVAASARMQLVRESLGGPEYWLLDDTLDGVICQTKRGDRQSAYTAIRWHLEFPYTHSLSPAFAAGLYLHESRRDNGCLAVVPTSHVSPVSLVPPEPLLVEAEPGDLICHHGQLYHASGSMRRESDFRTTIYFYFCSGHHPGARREWVSINNQGVTQALFDGNVDAESQGASIEH